MAGQPEIRGLASGSSAPGEGFVPFVPPTVGTAALAISKDDRTEEAAAIKASIHSPKVVQSRRRRKAPDPALEPSVGAFGALNLPTNLKVSKGTIEEMQTLRKHKGVVKATMYAGKSNKANSSRDDGAFTSAFKGVTKHKTTGKFEAHFWDKTYERPQNAVLKKPRRKGKQIYLGGFEKEADAAQAYDKAAVAYLGELAELNYPYEMYAEYLKAIDGMSRDDVIKNIKMSSHALRLPKPPKPPKPPSKVSKRRGKDDVDEFISGVEALCSMNSDAKKKPKRAGTKKANNGTGPRKSSRPAASKASKVQFAPQVSHAPQESPQFLPYSERKMKMEGTSLSDLLMNSVQRDFKPYEVTTQSISQSMEYLRNVAREYSAPRGRHHGHGHGHEPARGQAANANSPNPPLGFSFGPAMPGAGSSPVPIPPSGSSPVPISTVLKQEYNTIPSMTPSSYQGQHGSSPGVFHGIHGSLGATPAPAPAHPDVYATVTFDASGHVSGHEMKSWQAVAKSSDQNYDVLQLSPLAKEMQLSPGFAHRGIGLSPGKDGIPLPLFGMDDADLGVATFMNTDLGRLNMLTNSPGGMLQMPSPAG